jgi:hypothetical protein
MKKYCFDTSGISNPLETMPQDIHESMWGWFVEFIAGGNVAVTTEIYDEMVHIQGAVGDCIKKHKADMILEISKGEWDWPAYIQHVTVLQTKHSEFISEYTGGSPRTICLNDISIIALGKTLGLPVVSMERRITEPQAKKRRIPDVCVMENVSHLTFNQFLRAEKARW